MKLQKLRCRRGQGGERKAPLSPPQRRNPCERKAKREGIRSPLHRPAHDAADNLPPEDDEHRQRWQQNNHARRHDRTVGRAFGEVQHRHTDLHRAHQVVVRHQHRPEVGVPSADEGRNEDGGDNRRGERQQNGAEEADVPTAIHLAGFLQVLGEGQVILPHHEDVVCGDEENNHHAHVGVNPPQPGNRVVVRHQHDVAGNHHRAHDEHRSSLFTSFNPAVLSLPPEYPLLLPDFR